MRGGARARSGPMPDLQSARSDARGIAQDAVMLPASGYKYRPVKFPLAAYQVMDVWKDEDGLHREVDQSASEKWAAREFQLWKELWKLPQAVAWHMPQYSYLIGTVALYVRQFVICESPDAKAADRTVLQRYADTIGLTPQGLKLNNWRIYDDKAEKKAEKLSNDSKIVDFQSAKERYRQLGG